MSIIDFFWGIYILWNKLVGAGLGRDDCKTITQDGFPCTFSWSSFDFALRSVERHFRGKKRSEVVCKLRRNDWASS